MKTVITIGREYGSRGRLVAKKLSEALDIPFYDKEVIQGVVKKTGFAENFVRDAERRPTNSFIYDLYFSAQSLSTQDQVFIAQSGVIKDLAAAPTISCGSTRTCCGCSFMRPWRSVSAGPWRSTATRRAIWRAL